MLTEEEKQELREMAASASLREDFRIMRRNSRAMEENIGVDELAHWLTVMGRIFPGVPKPQCFVHYIKVEV